PPDTYTLSLHDALPICDLSDYQTMFASEEGAVAAPTAGLHFTPALEAALKERGIGLQRLTLHVGAGTFLPVKADDTSGHRMHSRSEEHTSELQSLAYLV